ncbi:tRNA1(Val) (adenine(37)-N6)-methyltransferase [Marinibacterium anthonyi]|nr:tRNA1(Val) (adenine(37)-N6)-methyltransferase [Marinibacterium anthonyi]
MTQFPDEDLSRDAFLGGKLFLYQPKSGYRAGVDPVLLAASVAAKPGDRVLDLGCGAGAAVLCLGTRVPGLHLHGIEVQPGYAALARRNAAEAGLHIDVIDADLTAPPPELRKMTFHHILANPPYFDPTARIPAADPGRERGLAEVAPLSAWVDFAARRLHPRGWLHVIQRTARLPDLLVASQGKLGSIEVLPLAARLGRTPEHVIFRARKDGRAPFRLHAPMILHEGMKHLSDAEDYSAEIDGILRRGNMLTWPV